MFHMYAQRPQREIPLLRKYPYKEGVGIAQNQMPLHVVGRSLTPFGRLMGSCIQYICILNPWTMLVVEVDVCFLYIHTYMNSMFIAY